MVFSGAQGSGPKSIAIGRMAERFKALVLKTSVRVTVPGVQIPLRPHKGVSVSDRNAFFVLCQVRSPCQQQSRSDLRECPAVADKSLGKSLIKRFKSDFQTLGHPTSESWLGGLG